MAIKILKISIFCYDGIEYTCGLLFLDHLLILHEFLCLLPTSYFLLSYIFPAKIFNKDIVMAKIAILGYGNLGRGVECAVKQAPDMELVAVFTRRDPSTVKIQTAGVPVLNVSEMEAWKDKVDLLIICGGSATDLPVLTPKYAAMFNVIDSFDTHAKIPQHFAAVDAAAKAAGKIAMISVGWDPGMFSLNPKCRVKLTLKSSAQRAARSW